MGLVGRILVDQVSTEDKQALEQGRGHVGPVEFDDVLPDHRQATTGTSYYGDTGFSTDVLEDLISRSRSPRGFLGSGGSYGLDGRPGHSMRWTPFSGP